jgi:hypothetical protein
MKSTISKLVNIFSASVRVFLRESVNNAPLAKNLNYKIPATHSLWNISS